MQQAQKLKILEAMKKEETAYNEKKRRNDEVMTLNVFDDEKLTTGKLRSLLNMKKRKTGKSISGLKKKDYSTMERVESSPTKIPCV